MASFKQQPLGQLLRRPPRYGINAAAVPLRPGVSTYIRITDIDQWGRFAPNPKVGVDHPASGAYILGDGELVFARTGASVGKSYLYDERDGRLVYAGFLINIAPDPERLDPKYLSLIAQTKAYWDWIARTSVRSGQPGINGKEYAQFPVPLPDIRQQRSIATTISDVDELIETLDRAIAKKRDVRKGLAQQLLSGSIRLNGFTGPWETLLFEQIAEPARERVNPSQVRPETRLIEMEHIGGGSGRLLGHATATDAVSLKTAFQRGDVLFGKLRSYLRKYWLADWDGICSTEIWALRPRPGASGPFVRYVVETERFIEVASGGYGTHMPRADWSVLRKLPVELPTPEEQAAMTRVLLDADAEIARLQDRLDKTRLTKQGMLQLLLASGSQAEFGGAA